MGIWLSGATGLRFFFRMWEVPGRKNEDQRKGISDRQHGFAREKEFTCVEESTEKLRYRLMSDEETRKYYPFDFVLWITYELREKEVLVSWEVENRSGEVMSFTIGGHPGFRFEKEGEQKEDYELYFPENTRVYRYSSRSGQRYRKTGSEIPGETDRSYAGVK